jgi:hypothetical protein
LFPTDAVVEPPFRLSHTGTAPPCPSPGPCPSSPQARDTPYPGLEGSPHGPAPVTTPDAGPGPSPPAPPARFA